MNSRDVDESNIRASRVREIKEYFVKKRFEEDLILRMRDKYKEFVKNRTV